MVNVSGVSLGHCQLEGIKELRGLIVTVSKQEQHCMTFLIQGIYSALRTGS